jgi:hypothetical protein
MNEQLEIHTDGITVWVNTAACIGRFGRFGIDIHQPAEKQLQMGQQCLYCTHTETTKEDWETFKAKMLELHQVTVSDRYMPKRFKPYHTLKGSSWGGGMDD